MLNKVILKGNVGHIPEIKLTQQGKQIAIFSLATSFSWKDSDGEWQTHVDWHRVIVFRKSTVGWIKDVLKKGDTVYVEGKLSYHPRVNKHNQKHFTPYIVIEDWHGSVEHLRSSKAPSQEEGQNSHQLNTQEDAFPLEERFPDFPSFPQGTREMSTSHQTPSSTSQNDNKENTR